MPLFETTISKVENWTATKNVKKLFGALSSADAVVQRAAAEGLSRIRTPEVLQYCRANAMDTNPKVRWHITQILGLIGTSEAMKILETVEDPTDAIQKKLEMQKKLKDKKK